ncbi:hypothetical protein ACQJBY_015008 [Aegilops geniculata]
MAMAMAMSRSVLARVARGGHPVYQPLLRAEGNPTADTMGKRFFSGFKGRDFYSILDKLHSSQMFDPVGPIPMLFAFTYFMGTMIPYTIYSVKRAKESTKELEDWKAEWRAYEADRQKSH